MVTASLLAAGALADRRRSPCCCSAAGCAAARWRPSTTGRRGCSAGFVIDLAFLGANGISRDHGLTTPDPAVAEVKAEVVRALPPRGCSSGLHTKFGAASFCRFAEIVATSRRSSPTPASARRGPPVLRCSDRRWSGPEHRPAAPPNPAPRHRAQARRTTGGNSERSAIQTRRLAMALALPAAAGAACPGAAGAGRGGGGRRRLQVDQRPDGRTTRRWWTCRSSPRTTSPRRPASR